MHCLDKQNLKHPIACHLVGIGLSCNWMRKKYDFGDWKMRDMKPESDPLLYPQGKTPKTQGEMWVCISMTPETLR